MYLGRAGEYAVAGISGFVDIDPFILGLTQSGTAVDLAVAGIVIATASNNFLKGLYALAFGGRKAGLPGAELLWVLAALSLVPLLFRF
jgi:uncharacterized membrane protein (DUF4010 family)